MRAGQRVYEQLRTEILDGDLAPGLPLAEVEIAQRFGTSRTPVREALGLLVADGLAEQSSGRGTSVTPVSTDDLLPLFEVREALEVQAARLAARRGHAGAFADLAVELEGVTLRLEDGRDTPAYFDLVERMDRTIDRAADNRWLDSTLAAVRTQLIRIRRLSAHDPSRLAAAAREHASIARAISSGSEQLAEAAVRLHLHHALQAALDKSDARHDGDRQHETPHPDHPTTAQAEPAAPARTVERTS
ncbi:GntR family transcriptional regulator [Kocuria palustris]|uniref:GntR family transcriptional regulator n=1 Tax=Kocuria palustris TaxID=71999 RepID=UPI0011A7AD30|nr:GntR family transcriptional regulator [Kocuria palustris]